VINRRKMGVEKNASSLNVFIGDRGFQRVVIWCSSADKKGMAGAKPIESVLLY
jgi:hypothetical protein